MTIDEQINRIAHTEEGLNSLYQTAAFADVIMREIAPGAVGDLLLNKARLAWIEGVRKLCSTNLHTPQGIAEAIEAQQEMRLYERMVSFVSEALDDGDAADMALEEEDEEDLVELTGGNENHDGQDQSGS